jgi:flagella basal body P-ring formation protein FlgA
MRNILARSPLTYLIAAVLCIAGTLSADAAMMQLPVPRITIYPGQVIEQSMLVERTFRMNDNDKSAPVPSSDALVGKVARQTLLPGRPINAQGVREPHAVTQGQATSVIFQSGALTITGSAMALQSGATGDVVAVRNVDSGTIIKGVIGADGAVHVGDP